MNKLLLLAILLFAAVGVQAQVTPATPIPSGGTLPATCSYGAPTTSEFYKTGASAGFYTCASNGTSWTGPYATGGGSGDVTGGSASVSGELAAYGDTTGKLIGRSFAAFSGPGSTVKTFTVPNANSTLVNGTGTTNALSKFTSGAAGTVGNSNLSDSGSLITFGVPIIGPAIDDPFTYINTSTAGAATAAMKKITGRGSVTLLWGIDNTGSNFGSTGQEAFFRFDNGANGLWYLNASTPKWGYNGSTGQMLASDQIFKFTSTTNAFTGTTDTTIFRSTAGTIGFGTTTSTANGTIEAAHATLNALGSDAATANNTVCATTTTGVLTKGSGTLGICLGTSSQRFKNRIYSLSDGLSVVNRLQPKRFFYNQGYGDSGARENVGFLAEDVQKVAPRLVGLDSAGQPLSVDYLAMVPMLVNAVKELNAKVETQQKEITRLRHQLHKRR